jgi:predicted nucleic acid-binding protein
VSDAIVLDSGPLGLLANPSLTAPTAAALQWLGQLLAGGRRVIVPALVDYEIRRELVRIQATRSIQSLDKLIQALEFLPETAADLRLAAEYWAQARQGGFPAAPDPALDIDVIIAAQTHGLGTPAIVATANVGHLTRFIRAEFWLNITP